MLPSAAAAAAFRSKRKRLRNRRIVLSEAQWEAALAATIERRYYPDLPLLRLLQQLLAAEGEGDEKKAQQIAHKISYLAAATPEHLQSAKRQQELLLLQKIPH